MGCNSQAKSAKAVASTRDAPVVPLKGEDVAPGRVRRESLAALMVGAALENFPTRKQKKKFWFHVGNILRTKLSEQAEPHPIPPPT